MKLDFGGVFYAALLASLLVLGGCDDGDDGDPGPAGATGAVGAMGPTGDTGPIGPAGTSAVDVVDVGSMFTAALEGDLEGIITEVAMDSPPVIAFKVTDSMGRGVTGLRAREGTRGEDDYFSGNIRFVLAVLQAAAPASRDPDTWARLAYDREGELIDNGDGSYVYTFTVDTTDFVPAYNPDLNHRLVLQVSGSTVSGSLPPLNEIYDFVPSGAIDDTSREIVAISSCNECHAKLVEHGSRYETKFCVTCHNPTIHAGADDEGEADFPVLIHSVHSANATYMDGEFADLRFPQEITNCAKCHTGDDAETPEGDNWITRPNQAACGACHSDVDFATGVNHAGGPQADNTVCTICHTPKGLSDIAAVHAETERSISATISAVDISDADGSVTVTFSVDDNGVAVTDAANMTSMYFTLAKLVPGTGAASNHWQSYTGRTRSKTHAGVAPVVVQGYSERASDGTLTHVTGGSWTYKFALRNATPHGDIRVIDHLHDKDNDTLETAFTVAYDPNLTHRVGMEFRDADGVRNIENAVFDFVPAGTAMTETRDIVEMAQCNTCHGGVRLHKGYTTEYCVTCHNQSTFDPFTEDDPVVVDFQHIIHKLHMGEDLANDYDVNHHDFKGSQNNGDPDVVFPQEITNCTVCHIDDQWKENPTSRACGTCHDSEANYAHIQLNILEGAAPASILNEFVGDDVEACETCHGEAQIFNVEDMHGDHG